jgi:hypothetical protein
MKRKDKIRWAHMHGSPVLRRLSVGVSLSPVLMIIFGAVSFCTRNGLFLVVLGTCSIQISSAFNRRFALENSVDDSPLSAPSNFRPNSVARWSLAILVIGSMVALGALLGPVSSEAKSLGPDPAWSAPFVFASLFCLIGGLILAVLRHHRASILIVIAANAGFVASFADWPKSHLLVYQQLAVFAVLGSLATFSWWVSARQRVQ